MSLETIIDELEARKQELEAQIAPLLKELSQIRAALHALDTPSAVEGVVEHPTQPKMPMYKRLLQLLEAHPEGLTALEMQAAIPDKKIASISVTLSRLKKEGVLNRDGFVWTKR